MRPAAALTVVAASALLMASRRGSVGVIEPNEADTFGQLGSFDPGAILERAEQVVYVVSEQLQQVAPMSIEQQDGAARNLAAFLAVIRQSEGTARAADPYRVCYGYNHVISSFADHPANSGEWGGERLSDAMCANAGFGPGCKSTAAGAYQIIRPTWVKLRTRLGLPDFSPASQDAAAVELIRQRGGLLDAQAGRLSAAVYKCRAEWASLPGNYAKQGQRSLDELAGWFSNSGGVITA